MKRILVLFMLMFGSVFAYKPVTVEHELGKATIKAKPQRVVIFDYGLLDIAQELDVNVVGVIKYLLPDFLAEYKKDKYGDVGTFFEANFEAIFELEPDLILISGRQSRIYNDLNKIAPTIYLNAWGPTYFEDLETNATVMGQIFGKETYVEKRLKGISEDVKDLKEEVGGRRGIVLATNGPDLAVYGAESRFDQVYSSFGFVPADKDIPASTHGNKVSFEYLYEINPDYIFVLDKSQLGGDKKSAKEVLNNDIMKKVSATKNDNITILNLPAWYLATGGFDATDLIIEDIKGSIK